MIELFVLVFVMLLVVIDLFGCVLIYVGLLCGVSCY